MASIVMRFTPWDSIECRYNHNLHMYLTCDVATGKTGIEYKVFGLTSDPEDELLGQFVDRVEGFAMVAEFEKTRRHWVSVRCLWEAITWTSAESADAAA